jgi:dihydrofolate synthase/folylpolyglutamate synthase
MARRGRAKRLPLPIRGERGLARLAEALVDHERSDAFRRGRVALSLAATRRLVRWLDDPLRGVPVVHVAGSKGKGSVCLFVAALLRELGLRVGVYLSPHVERWSERIQVDGAPLPPRTIGRSIERVLAAARRHGAPLPTLFETLTAAAFDAFRAARVEVAVVEVGIGGRLDATNVVTSDVAVVTSLEREHTAVLGRTIEAIAWQKAGIFERGSVALSGVPPRSRASKVLRRVAREVGAPFEFVSPRSTAVVPPVGGPFARANAALAIAAVAALARRRPRLALPTAPAELEAALERALRRLRLPGRMELVDERPRTWRDGAHTPASLKAVVGAVARESGSRPVVVLALKSDKPLVRCLRALAGDAGPLVATTVPGGRSRSPEEIVAVARRLGIMARSIPEPGRALRSARRLAGPRGAVLVTGSFWLAGAVPRRTGATTAWTSRSSTTSS